MLMRNRNQIAATGPARACGLAATLAGLLMAPSLARADTYDCSAVAMYKFAAGNLEKVPDASLVPHQSFRVDTTRAFVRVGANVAGMKELKLENPVAIRQRGGWVGQLRDETGVYRGTLELRPDLPYATNGNRAHSLDFIWSGTLSFKADFVLSGTCVFAGA